MIIVERFHNNSGSYQHAHSCVGYFQGGMWCTHVGMEKSNAINRIIYNRLDLRLAFIRTSLANPIRQDFFLLIGTNFTIRQNFETLLQFCDMYTKYERMRVWEYECVPFTHKCHQSLRLCKFSFQKQNFEIALSLRFQQTTFILFRATSWACMENTTKATNKRRKCVALVDARHHHFPLQLYELLILMMKVLLFYSDPIWRVCDCIWQPYTKPPQQYWRSLLWQSLG